MRIGLFGGSFDPVHLGHLLLAETCREAACLDQVWFIPAAQSPHKQGRLPSDSRHRVQMLHLAIGGYAPFVVNECELERGGVSYTVETLEQIHQANPHHELHLLMGADALRDFPTWRSPARICELAKLLVVARPDAEPPDPQLLAAFLPSPGEDGQPRCQTITMPPIAISSTELRRRIARGQSIRYRVPQAVELYIASQQLYRDDSVG